MQLSDRTYPILSRICIGMGVAFLAISAFGNWRFGLSLTADPVDRYWLAIIYAGSDVAAGVLVATGATMLRQPGWRWKMGGVAALIPAFALVILSILSTFGVMSGRIAVLAGQQASVANDTSRLAWLRGQTVNRDLPRSERRAFLVEERKAAAEARKAASVVTDNQAVAVVNLAALVGMKLSPQGAQVGLTLASSTIPMAVKFLCLGFGFFLFGSRVGKAVDPDKKTQAGSGGGSGSSGSGEPRKPTLVHTAEPAKPAARTMEAAPVKVSSVGSRVSTDAPTGKLTFEQFRELVREDMAHGEPASSTRALKAATGWSQTSVVREQKRVRGQANSKIRRFAGNGGGLHVLANG